MMGKRSLVSVMRKMQADSLADLVRMAATLHLSLVAHP
jgi:hypothetical protein